MATRTVPLKKTPAKSTTAARSRTAAATRARRAEEHEIDESPSDETEESPFARGKFATLNIDPIEIEAEEEQPGIPLRLVGQDYTIHPPKMAMALKIGKVAKQAAKSDDPEKIATVLEQWIVSAFGKRIGSDVMGRLDDADDLLDYDHIMQLIEKVSEAQAEGMQNPPT